jgi:hypothetical protein
MATKGFLDSIRMGKATALTTRRKAAYVLFFLALGMLLGFMAKYIDGVRSSNWIGTVYQAISDISSRIGIWVFISVVIACWSRTPKAGAIYVFIFFVGMLLIYYLYSMKLFGFFPKHYLFRWGLIALISPAAAYMIWFGKGQGWAAALCASCPIALLAAQGYSFLYTLAAVPGFDFISAIALFFVLPEGKNQHLKVLPLVVIIMFLLRKFEILAYLYL